MDIYKMQIYYKTNCYYLWVSDEQSDSFLVIDGEIACFDTQEHLQSFISKKNISIIDENTVFTILSTNKLIESLETNTLWFCDIMISQWNMAIDIQNSFSSKSTLLNGHKQLYDKLFYGCNLQSMNTTEKIYIPTFTTLEKRQLKAVINEMYKWFNNKLEILYGES